MMAATDNRDEDRPATAKTQLLSLLAGLVAMAGFSAALGVVGAVLFDPDIKHPVNWMTWAFMALFAAVGAAGVWGLVRLKPWAGKNDPISPSTRKTNALFAWSGLAAVPGALALVYGTFDRDAAWPMLPMFSNSPVALWIAGVFSVSWLTGMAIGWWWYFSADEHERDAYDVASVVGAGFFTVVTPVWWVAARAGLGPQPDAMILWLITMLVITIAWFWRRSA